MTLIELVAVLIAVCVAVPVSRRLGFGSVLGYLTAGIVIGPFGLSLVDDGDHILHIAEFGVVLLLFIIGLELQPSRLRALRRSVFGLGAAQVLVTSTLIYAAALAAGQRQAVAIVVGLALALSSTAFVLQILAEKKELVTRHGRSSFAILLFQDLAVIPILALIPVLSSAKHGDGHPLVDGLVAIVAIAALIAGGRYLLRPAFRLVAARGGTEIFTAAALLVVIGAALLMEAAGVSMALGAFLAGVLLAESEFRHQLEAEIEPFKGLLLGLFFVAVGMTANLELLLQRPGELLGITIGLLTLKGLTLYGLGRSFGLPGSTSVRIAFLLPQGGEFAFVILGIAVGAGVMDRPLADFLIMVVTLSMLATPFLVTAGERLGRRPVSDEGGRPYDSVETDDHKVVIAGMGRFGQVVARLLHVRRIPFTAIEADATHVDFIRRFNASIYYGNIADPDMLRAARVDKADAFVVAVNDMNTAVRVIETLKSHYPRLKIFARARDRHSAHRFADLGVDYIIRENFVSSLELGRAVLEEIGDSAEVASRTMRRFREADERLLRTEHAVFHEKRGFEQSVEAAWQELEGLFEADEQETAQPPDAEKRGP
ncbi:MAG: monovalent cation:proton antiporter-2 (CPA2) family protein [Chromatiales bacterium]|jgi:glutathione-regulated potassium-efflux system ancillary protein KefC/glutathione-regulated potassium-efflux system protein KefB|nr:monovalent cation:proton antiporter-2 (CPA2) family protein [Chromatiales bacterium]